MAVAVIRATKGSSTHLFRKRRSCHVWGLCGSQELFPSSIKARVVTSCSESNLFAKPAAVSGRRFGLQYRIFMRRTPTRSSQPQKPKCERRLFPIFARKVSTTGTERGTNVCSLVTLTSAAAYGRMGAAYDIPCTEHDAEEDG